MPKPPLPPTMPRAFSNTGLPSSAGLQTLADPAVAVTNATGSEVGQRSQMGFSRPINPLFRGSTHRPEEDGTDSFLGLALREKIGAATLSKNLPAILKIVKDNIDNPSVLSMIFGGLTLRSLDDLEPFKSLVMQLEGSPEIALEQLTKRFQTVVDLLYLNQGDASNPMGDISLGANALRELMGYHSIMQFFHSSLRHIDTDAADQIMGRHEGPIAKAFEAATSFLTTSPSDPDKIAAQLIGVSGLPPLITGIESLPETYLNRIALFLTGLSNMISELPPKLQLLDLITNHLRYCMPKLSEEMRALLQTNADKGLMILIASQRPSFSPLSPTEEIIIHAYGVRHAMEKLGRMESPTIADVMGIEKGHQSLIGPMSMAMKLLEKLGSYSSDEGKAPEERTQIVASTIAGHGIGLMLQYLGPALRQNPNYQGLAMSLSEDTSGMLTQAYAQLTDKSHIPYDHQNRFLQRQLVEVRSGLFEVRANANGSQDIPADITLARAAQDVHRNLANLNALLLKRQ